MITVLLIDDDASFAQIVTTTLSSEEFTVLAATTGAQGIAKAKTETPDIILLDEVLPDMRGTAVLVTLKGDENTASIPVVICSAYMNPQMEEEATKYGAIGYLLKFELDPPILQEKIKQMLHIAPNADTSANK